MHRRTPRTLAAAAALALALGACTDVPTGTPASRAPGSHARLTSSAGPTLVPNSVKYRDRGGHPAHGRSGNATLDAIALVNRQGVTTLGLSAKHAVEWWRYGSVTKAQVKASDASGRHKFTRNLTESYPWLGAHGPIPGDVQLVGLGGGDQVQVQANVEGLDGNRVDVVTVTETVKRLPDLRVAIQAPPQAETNTPVNILAVVSEANGDLGSYAVCELYVSGQLADYAPGIWVDAGDAVTCALTYRFGTAGTYPVEVRVSNALYGTPEWDTSNNSDSATIEVHGESASFTTSAFFTQTTSVDSSLTINTWTDSLAGSSGEYRAEYTRTAVSQYATLYGVMPAQIAAPTGFKISMSTGPLVVHADEWTEPGYGASSWCTFRFGGPVMFWLCTSAGPFQPSTTFMYALIAGAVTYHGQEYSRVWDHLTGTEQVYHWNTDTQWDDGVVPLALGDDWTFEVKLASGGVERDASRTVPLTRTVSEWSYPLTCSSWGYPEWGYFVTNCSASSSRVDAIFGT